MAEQTDLGQVIHEITNELPAKTRAVFEAVNDLLQEGVDLSSIKVADIAKRAGIGKGTVYEYFSNKEEILIKAMAYDYAVNLGKIRNLLFQEKSFQGKIMKGIQWMRENFYRTKIFFRYLNSGFKQVNAKTILEEMDPRLLDCASYRDIFDNVVESGKKEGLIAESITSFQCDSAFIAVTGIFVHYMTTMGYYEEMDDQKLDLYLYQSFLKIVQ